MCSSDLEVIVWSVQQKAIVITLDADFHAILAVSGARGPSVIRIRRQGLTQFGSWRSSRGCSWITITNLGGEHGTDQAPSGARFDQGP